MDEHVKLEDALTSARLLANLSCGYLDWGFVSNIGCDIVHGLEELKKILQEQDSSTFEPVALAPPLG